MPRAESLLAAEAQEALDVWLQPSRNAPEGTLTPSDLRAQAPEERHLQDDAVEAGVCDKENHDW